MAPVSVAPKTIVQVTEQQSLLQAQELISMSMSCVAFLRKLFPDECFDFERKYGLQLKQLKTGRSKKSDQFLKYVEEGCHDAIEKKYLKSIVLSILEDRMNPKDTISQMSILIDRNKQPVTAVSTVEKLRESAGVLLKQLCALTRVLPSLPKRKFVKMLLMYYEDVTPKEYEPPGFIPSLFELDSLFHGDTVKTIVGAVASPHNMVGLSMERLLTDSEHPLDNHHSTCQNSIEDGTQGNASYQHTDNVGKSANKNKGNDSCNSDKTVCLCGCNLSDLDMVQCECCSSWQHTVCAGFYSNRDHRLQSINYICSNCRFANEKAVLQVVKNLSAYRRALSVVFNEGIGDVKTLARRLGYSGRSTSRQLHKMVEDKFIIQQPGKNPKFAAVKTKQVRDKLRQYFSYDLTKFPVFEDCTGESMTQPKVIRIHPENQFERNRASVTELTLSVSELME